MTFSYLKKNQSKIKKPKKVSPKKRISWKLSNMCMLKRLWERNEWISQGCLSLDLTWQFLSSIILVLQIRPLKNQWEISRTLQLGKLIKMSREMLLIRIKIRRELMLLQLDKNLLPQKGIGQWSNKLHLWLKKESMSSVSIQWVRIESSQTRKNDLLSRLFKDIYQYGRRVSKITSLLTGIGVSSS